MKPINRIKGKRLEFGNREQIAEIRKREKVIEVNEKLRVAKENCLKCKSLKKGYKTGYAHTCKDID